MAFKKNISALSSPVAASAAAIFGRFLTLGTGALTGILLPLSMKQETVGLFFLSQSLIAALATLGILGLNITAPACISRAIGQNDYGQVKQTIRRSLSICFFSVISLALTFSFFMWLLSSVDSSELINVLQKLAPLVSISMILAAMATLLSEQHRAIGHFVQASFLTTGSSLASAAIVVLAWQSKLNLQLDALLLAGAIGVACGTALGGYSLWRWHRRHLEPVSNTISYREILLQTRPNLTTTLVLFVVAQADLWVIAYFGDTAQLAIYGLASRLASLVLIPLAVVNTVIAPSIGRIWVRNKKRFLQKILRVGAGAATGLAIAGYLLFILTGKFVLSKIWSTEYSEAYYIFAILGVSQIVQTYAGTAGFVLMMLQKQHVAMRISVGSGVIMVVCGSLAMAQFGIMGLAIAYSLGGIVQSLLMIYCVKRIFDLDTKASYLSTAQFVHLYIRRRIRHER
jgi:O-antigen/teichoic acid export membrane protein